MSVTFPILALDGANPIPKPGFGGPYATSVTIRYLLTTIDTGMGVVATMLKSTDTGATWAEVDAANAVQLYANTVGGGATMAVSCLDSDGHTIHVVFQNEAGNLSIIPFSTATDLWGSAIAGPMPDYTATSGIIRMACVQNSAGAIVVVGDFSINASNKSISSYALVTAGSWSSFTNFSVPPEITDPNNLSGYLPLAVCVAGDLVHCFFFFSSNNVPVLVSGEYHQSLSGASLNGLTVIANSATNVGEGIAAPPSWAVFDAGAVYFATTSTGTDPDNKNLQVANAANIADLSLSLSTVDVGGIDNVNVADLSISVVSAGQLYYFYVLNNQDTGVFPYSYLINATGSAVLIGSTDTALSSFVLQSSPTSGTTGWAIAFVGSQLYWEEGAAPPPAVSVVAKSVGGGATYFPRFFNKSFLVESIARIYGTRFNDPRGRRSGRGGRGTNDDSGADWFTLRDNPPLSSFFLFPNHNDLCLSREFILYNHIDRQAMSCAHKPECFLRSERDWLDSPTGWRVFNPVGVLSLPAPSAGDVVVFSFRVPYGYDGVITAQYHSYTLGFSEGSGDLAWRVRADGRYLRDCGDMEVSLGNPKQLSPVNGGLQLRSGNLVEYLVSAPNTSGLLPPGGNILAGLHGFFYPRM